jgi:hypothetical protein
MLTKLIFFSTFLLSTSFDTCFFHEFLEQTEVPPLLVKKISENYKAFGWWIVVLT